MSWVSRKVYIIFAIIFGIAILGSVFGGIYGGPRIESPDSSTEIGLGGRTSTESIFEIRTYTPAPESVLASTPSAGIMYKETATATASVAINSSEKAATTTEGTTTRRMMDDQYNAEYDDFTEYHDTLKNLTTGTLNPNPIPESVLTPTPSVQVMYQRTPTTTASTAISSSEKGEVTTASTTTKRLVNDREQKMYDDYPEVVDAHMSSTIGPLQDIHGFTNDTPVLPSVKKLMCAGWDKVIANPRVLEYNVHNCKQFLSNDCLNILAKRFNNDDLKVLSTNKVKGLAPYIIVDKEDAGNNWNPSRVNCLTLFNDSKVISGEPPVLTDRERVKITGQCLEDVHELVRQRETAMCLDGYTQSNPKRPFDHILDGCNEIVARKFGYIKEQI